MYFVIQNSVVLSKILKFFLLYKIDYSDNNRHRQTGVKMAQRFSIFWITPVTTELWMTKYIIGEIFSSGGATLYKNLSDQTVLSEFLTSLSKVLTLWHCVKATLP